jgi:hypothetical protein
VHTAANASNLPADGHNKPAVHTMKVAGLAIIPGQFDSLAPNICGNAHFCGCVVAWREMGGPCLDGWLGVNAGAVTACSAQFEVRYFVARCRCRPPCRQRQRFWSFRTYFLSRKEKHTVSVGRSAYFLFVRVRCHYSVRFRWTRS